MAYDWIQLGIKEITNLFLYGQVTTPSDLTDESLIRPKDVNDGPQYGADVEVNMASFMATGPGRFALGSESELVRDFMDAGTDLSWMEVYVKRGRIGPTP